jgi:hypothetical protein
VATEDASSPSAAEPSGLVAACAEANIVAEAEEEEEGEEEEGEESAREEREARGALRRGSAGVWNCGSIDACTLPEASNVGGLLLAETGASWPPEGKAAANLSLGLFPGKACLAPRDSASNTALEGECSAKLGGENPAPSLSALPGGVASDEPR